MPKPAASWPDISISWSDVVDEFMPSDRTKKSRRTRSLFNDLPTGGVISKITPRTSNPNVRSIHVGRKTVATLRAADVKSLNLKVGDPWTKAVSRRVALILKRQKALSSAMNMLGRRSLSKSDLAHRLVAKGNSRVIAGQVAEELASAGWINEPHLADALIHHVTRAKPAGRTLIRNTLQAKGLPNQVIEDSLADNDAMKDEMANALRLAKSRLRHFAGLPNSTIRRRIASLLARRGFEDDTIEQVLDRLQLSPRESN